MRHNASQNNKLQNTNSQGISFEKLEDRLLLSAVVVPSQLENPADPSAIMIDAAAQESQGTLDCQIYCQWNTGFQAELVLTNTSGEDWTEWTVEFDFPQEITSIWNARITQKNGESYTISNASWNGAIMAGQSIHFGWIAKMQSGDTPAALSNIVVNHQEIPTPVNTPPIAVNDSAQTRQDTPIVIHVLSNDSDADGDTLTITSYTQPEHGAVTQVNGLLHYTPDSGYYGGDSFRYTISDGEEVAEASVSITVDQVVVVNQPPVAQEDTASVTNDSQTQINVLANDSDADGDTLSIVGWTQTTHGTLTKTDEGIFLYTPNAGYVGGDQFTYTITDGEDQATAPVNITVSEPATPAVTSWPDCFFAPYVDMTLPSDYSMAEMAETMNVKYFTLAFVVADNTTSEPSWGSYYSTDSGYRLADIEELRAMGGDVMISFGGAANTELAVAITDVNELTSAYQSVIDKYALTMIDFDIEGAWLGNRGSIDRRSQAIANLQASAAAEEKELGVWFTLPVLPSGLTADGLYAIESALRHGVNIAGVNIMAMDYGDGAAPNPAGLMGEYAIEAAQSLHAQLTTLYSNAGIHVTEAELWKKIGITPMIGQNDIHTEVFDLQDAQQVVDFASDKNIGMLSFWSACRDSGGAGLSNYHSGIAQEDGAFHTIFAPFTGDNIPAITISDASVMETDAGLVEMVFTVTLSQACEDTVTVQYATADGEARAGSDYASQAGVLTFAPGETQKDIHVTVHGELAVEGDETFTVALSNVVNAKLRTDSATGTILDDDAPPTVSLQDVSVEEGHGGTTHASFVATLSRALKDTESVTIAYATHSGTAIAGEDFIAATGTLLIGPGEQSGVITIDVIGEEQEESDETFQLDLTSVSGATIEKGSATGTIEDDDTPMGVAALSVTSDWGSGHIGKMTLTNTTDVDWNNWRLTFEYEYEITSIWSAEIVSHVGNTYVIKPAFWTTCLEAGGSLNFGFQANGSPHSASPEITATLIPVL